MIDELEALADRAVAGSGSLVLLTGEAGIGKSSVARALTRAASGSLAVAWGSCPADRSAPPFWPWREVLDVDRPSGAVPDGPEDAIGAPRYERLNELRARLFDRDRPLLLVIEDLQWADVASVLLLAHVAVRLADHPVLLLATQRTGEPIDGALEHALEDVRRGAEVRSLPPLPDDAVDELLREAGIEPASALAAVVRERTGGNPLFVTELLRSARGSDGEERIRETVAGSVPDRVADLVAHQLARLPGPLVDVVVTASAVGSDGDVRTLASARGTSEASIIALVEQARAARLLDAVDAGRWRFRHDLVRDAVYASADAGTRAQVHAAILAALAAGGDAPPPVLARHALAGLPEVDAERAVALAAQAGGAAFAQGAYEEAVRWCRQALAVAPPGSAPRWRAELLVLVGEAHRQLGAVGEARRAFLAAADLVDDPELLARAALGYADPGADLGIAYRTEDLTMVALTERAIAAQSDHDSVRLVRLEARLAAELYFSDQPDRSRVLAGAAVERAGRLGDRRALVASHAVAHDAFVVGQAPLDVQLRGSQALLDWALEAGSAAALLTARRARVLDLLAAGDLPGMDLEVVAFRRLAEPLRSPGYLWWLSLWSAMRALVEGRHGEAERLAFDAHAIGERSFPTLAFSNLSFLLFFLRREQGRLDELEQATRDYAATQADVPAIRVALLLLLAETGRTDEAGAMLRALSADDLHRLHDRNWPASWFQLARAAFLVGDRDVATTLSEDRRRPTERCVPVSLATVCLGATDLAHAWLLHTAGDLDAADARYRSAEDLNARIGARSWLAQTRADRAQLLLERGRDDRDRDEARRLADLARAPADEIGLGSLAAHLDRLGAQLHGGSSAPVREVMSSARARFQRQGDVWELEFAGRRAQLADGRGLHDLARLLARPGEPVSALELQGGPGRVTDPARGAPTLDERARREIAERLRDLDAEVDDAEARHDTERAARAREQRQQLAEAVARDLGLGGRARLVGDPVEKARKTVSTRIRRSIAAIERLHPELGRHLDRSVDTGAWCAYRPAEPVDWLT